MLRKYPAFGSVINSIKYQIVGNDHRVTTAATDGKTIYVNADFMSKLSDKERVFVFAHEVCHIALNHILRSKDKDSKLWNIATDAVINQYLKKDGLPMIDGGVDIEGALKYDAEELYEELVQRKHDKQKQSQSQSQQQQTQQGEQDQSQSQQQQDNQAGHDSHSMWEDAVKEEMQEEQKQQNQDKQQNQNEKTKGEIEQQPHKTSERECFDKNDQEKTKLAEEVWKEKSDQSRGIDGQRKEIYVRKIGTEGKPVVNWKKLLVRCSEKEDERWGHKYSDSSNGYAARIEDVEIDEMAECEIILDTSGSVSMDLLKTFLRQVKTILKNYSTIRVGTFSNKFNGWFEIKRKSDIDNIKITIGGGTNFNEASKAFTRRKDVNKICFTDGCDGGNAGIEDKRKDIVWISFENPNFKPDEGEVVFVPKNLINLQTKEKSRETTK